ncbi:phage tail protein [Gallibacterium anatis]|uniref:Phage tail protein n=1 Tax=Gallibacterium anatis TaxID=750 RepID=A0AAX3XEB0_9PAST|nr:phage tail protein [Gallibacterium anatis]MDK9430985.1 phage tail protein [Gallibacterium anatis]WIM80528.1 phage tail protein [Gallibacterium anatis]
MASKLTQAFETYIRDSVINHTPVIFDEFIFANIPGLSDDNLDSHLTIPQENQIVHRQEVSQIGALNENAIVYSVTVGTEIGDFDFNWVGLVNKSQNLLACGIYTGLTSKIKNKEQKQGNSITRSVLLEFPRAQELANVSVSAETWQIDFTMRLSGIDEKIRLTNRDLYGRAVFFDNAFLLKRKSGNVYTLDSGRAYIEGVRAEIKRTAEVAVPTLPASVYIDVCHHATVTGAYQTEIKYLTQSKNDYVGADGYQHYVQIVADIASDGAITDRRLTDNAPPYIAERKKSDSVTSASSETVATSKAVKTAYDKAVDGVNKANAAQTAANNAQTTANAAIPSSKKSDSVASASSDTVATSKAVKSAYDKAVDGVNKANAAQTAANNANSNANKRVLDSVKVSNLNTLSGSQVFFCDSSPIGTPPWIDEIDFNGIHIDSGLQRFQLASIDYNDLRYRFNDDNSGVAGAGEWSHWRRIAMIEDFTQNLAATGWCRLPNGLLLQWGAGSGAGKKQFPVAFRQVYQVFGSGESNGDANRDWNIYFNSTHVWGYAQRIIRYFAIGE